MFCKYCGAEIKSEDNLFCENCGKKIRETHEESVISDVTEGLNREIDKEIGATAEVVPPVASNQTAQEEPTVQEEPGKQSKFRRYKKQIIAGTIAAFVIIIGVIGFHIYSVNDKIDRFQYKVDDYVALAKTYTVGTMDKEYEALKAECNTCISKKDAGKVDDLTSQMDTMKNKIIKMNDQVKEYKTKLTEFKKAPDTYYIDQVKKVDYDDMVSKYEDAVNKFDVSQCKEVSAKADTFVSGLKKDNISQISKLKEEFDGDSTSGLLEYERMTVSQAKKKAAAYESQNLYKKAYEILNTATSMVKQAGNYSGDVDVAQLDVSKYPTVKLYLSVNDANGTQMDNLIKNGFQVYERNSEGSDYNSLKVTKAVQMNEVENLNIDLVADVSSSLMDHTDEVEDAIDDFVDQIQFNVGDKAGLLSFADSVTRLCSFSSDANKVKESLSNSTMGDSTALYDALYCSVSQIARENGAKCVVAFTDGGDNNSNVTPEAVKSLAKRYRIPIYIIGIGDYIDYDTLEDIATSTGGEYNSIDSVSSMNEVYEKIYKEQKSMYAVEFKADQDIAKTKEHKFYVKYEDNGQGLATRCEYSFTPSVFMEASTATAKYNTDGYVFSDSDSRYLTVADLQQLDEKEIRIARNEIYARRGRRFKDKTLQAHFDKCSWYHGTTDPDDFDATCLNAYERANAYFIRQYEELYGLNK